MNGRFLFAAIGAILIAVVAALWFSGLFGSDVARDAVTQPEAPPETVNPRLVPVVEAARAAAAQATSDANAADAVSAATDKVAASAAKFAADGKTAAEEAAKIAKKACKAPSATLACATAEDGTRYEGAQACRTDGCGPDGFGVFTDERRGWESQGKWENWSLVLGCDSMKGVTTYCGQQVASAWSGFGISYNSEAAAISAEWLAGAGKNPIQLDYPTGSRMRGEMAEYKLDGLGVYERSDKRVLRGRWQAGKLISGIVAYPASGDVVSGTFLDGNAQSGSIAYRDGHLFVGEIEDGPALAEAKPKRGVLYAPDGSIAAQGAWRDGLPVATD
ncbi:hypothetical protein sos41_41300 [Alphaproteobacteria bacterium SO-S41]|nr:hypothetical protein sos41_41300 [Alphaproteobacteria bacterium SO-S41]